MLKKIKATKYMRLDELIKYIFEENIKADENLIKYRSKFGTVVEVDMSGQIAIYGRHFGNELYTVEIEEEITEDTEFELLVELYYSNGKYWSINHLNNSIYCAKDDKTVFIYALIDNKLQLIWERDRL